MKQGCMTHSNKNGTLAFSSKTGFALTKGSCEGIGVDGRSLVSIRQPMRKGFIHKLSFKQISRTAVEFQQSIVNKSEKPANISALRIFNGRLNLEGKGWRAAHSELFKRERCFDGYTIATGHYLSPMPGLEGEFGLSEDWPFPGMFFTHPERGTILMAVLSQNRFKPYWSLKQRGRNATLFQAFECFTGVDSINIMPNEKLIGEQWVILFNESGIEDAVEQYYKLLRSRIEFVGANSILRRAIVWGSWNYNRRGKGFAEISHKILVDNARALKKLVPNKPRVAIIDDGYQQGRSRITDMQEWFSSSLEIFYNNNSSPHDPKLFPRGMKAIADDMRKAGVIPALWFTIRLNRNSALARQRPEWLLRTENNRGFGARSAYLDYSISEVRDYIRNAWKTIFHIWGYKGVKLDFWSLPFEIPQVRYRNRDRTAVELRNLLLEDLREFIPEDGFLLLAVVANSGGNPFVGKYADAARMGADIGKGAFFDIHQAAFGITMSTPFYRHDCLLGDPDSIGWCPESTPGQNRLWATLALMSGGICEIGGDLTGLTPDARAMLRTVARIYGPRLRSRNGITDYAVGAGGLPSDRIVLESDDAVYVGELNWTPYLREIRMESSKRDLWTGKRIKDRYQLPPNDAVMYRI